MTGTETIAYGYAWDNKTRDWTHRFEYLARDLDEAQNWIRFNKDFFKNCGIEEQHDSHVFTWITNAF
jgi:hypothetical protein